MPLSPAVEPETLPIHTRGLTGFPGPYGAGKTTTIGPLLGLEVACRPLARRDLVVGD